MRSSTPEPKLDFARIGADRLTSTFEPTDLSTLTAGLAGSFRSLVQSAGLALRVECRPFSHRVYVDRWQWEKIVRTLISNAFKFTYAGEIAVFLHEADEFVHLTVRDTGIGIPADELPKIFERFHRVEGARGRSFEGSGIGLSLVRELANRHGGTVHVESVVGQGTTFVVSIPKRVHHPAGDAVIADAPQAQAAPLLAAAPGVTTPRRERVLIVDDDADMRRYLVQLLSPTWAVETAQDGEAALAAALRQPPDLVLTDVMMPRMDGVALLAALRAHPRTSSVPIVLLSARAGEDEVVGGLDTGADDYLAKPFTARELLARVRTHLNIARLRRESAAVLARANEELEAFSYSVSHDLRAPLRAIDGFTKALMDDYGPMLDGTAGDYLRRVRRATLRMTELIDDLLALARIARAPVDRTRVDVTALATRIASDLQDGDPARRVDVSIAGGMTAEADSSLLAVALENLLGNAWKFTAKRADAKIEVGQEHRSPAHVFFVRDNGAGFDMAHATRLFAPFQRLHAESEFPGTGIGLATVQRVVSRHGGRIWADGAEGRGATFSFTLGGSH